MNAGSIEGPAFPTGVKALATLMMFALGVGTWRAFDELAAAQLPGGSIAFLVAALIAVFACYAAMLRSRVSLDATHLRQTWLWEKRVALADVGQVKLVRIPGLDWIVAPRLVLKLRGGGLRSFHVAEPRIWQLMTQTRPPAPP